jgi:hypothetical protein
MMPTSISIITCTRNPPEDAIRRVLAGIESLRWPPESEREYVIIDSASQPPLADRPVIRGFVQRNPWTRVLRTDTPGLSTARRLALRESAGDLLVWFDDDNVPAADYLEQAARAATAHPEATVWGAGTIDVAFTDQVPAWVDPGMRPTFQQRAHGRDEFGHATTWAPYFPVGSGMVTRRPAMTRWAERTERGAYTLTGRHGARLSSGDDAQIIFGAVAAGEAVGVVAGQRLTHLIPGTRCTLEYLRHLEFALSASLRVARAECFPDDATARSRSGLGFVAAARATFAARRAHGARAARLEAARRLGALSGALEATNRPEPWWLRAAIAVLDLR